MQLAHLLEGVPEIFTTTGALDVDISVITSDSRQVTPGALFVAYRGVGIDGHRFVADALARGAAAVVGELPTEELFGLSASVPYVQVANGRAALAWLHAAWYGHPSRSMIVVGVTGTDGKTTTCNLLFSILQAAGVRAGMISTVNAVIGDRTYDTGLHTTTPDAEAVQRFLAEMRDARTQIAVLETTSHGLAQHRVTGVEYDIAVVTNITHEHLDFHGSYEAYREAKAMLFRSLLGHLGKEGLSAPTRPAAKPGLFAAVNKTSVLNGDDESYAYLMNIRAPRYFVYGGLMLPPLVLYPLTQLPVTVVYPSEIEQGPASTKLDVAVMEKYETTRAFHLTTRLVGRFNVYNIMAAVCAALALDISTEAIQAGVAALAGVPGRLERIDHGQDFAAIVDFAHTPNALVQALQTARDLVGSQQQVIAVFGSAGLRDREKRRLMGEVAAKYADFTVITAEDPRTEDLDAILAETADAMTKAGRVEGKHFIRVGDRQLAILQAVRSARAGDIVMVCGKGHEQSMCFGTVEHPWRDQDALAWALDELLGKRTGAPPFMLPTWKRSTNIAE